jgi:hypothetical protein
MPKGVRFAGVGFCPLANAALSQALSANGLCVGGLRWLYGMRNAL